MTKGSPGAGCTNRQMSLTWRGMRQHRREVLLRGRLVQRLFRRGQPPGQRHVKEPRLEHIRIAPAHQHSVLLRRQAGTAAARQVRPRTAVRGTDRDARRTHRPVPAMADRARFRATPGSRTRRTLPAPARRTARCGRQVLSPLPAHRTTVARRPTASAASAWHGTRTAGVLPSRRRYPPDRVDPADRVAATGASLSGSRPSQVAASANSGSSGSGA